MHGECEQLDDFLAGALPADVVTRFAGHMQSCTDCRAAIDEQRWIDGLLRSPVHAEIEPPPAELVTAIQTTLTKSRQRAGVFAVGFAAAAVLFVAVGWVVFNGGERAESVRPASVDVAEVRDAIEVEQEEVAVAPPRAIVDGGPDMIVVPLESPYPDVTIVRMYPVYQPTFAAHSGVTPQRADDVLQ